MYPLVALPYWVFPTYQVAWLVEQSYDILPAESMLMELEAMMGGERFQEEGAHSFVCSGMEIPNSE